MIETLYKNSPVFSGILAVLCFTYGAAVMGEHGEFYSPFEIGLVWYAAAVIAPFLFLIATGNLGREMRDLISHPKHSATVLFFGIGDGLFWFFGLLLVGLMGIAVAGRLSPAIMMVYSFFVLKEKHTSYQFFWMCLMLAAGLMFSFGLDFSDKLFGYLLAVIGAVFSAFFIISKKKAAGHIHGKALHMLRAALIWIGIYALHLAINKTPFPAITLPAPAIFLIASGGISNAVFGQFLRMKAFNSGGNLALIAMIMNFSPVLIFLYGLFILGEPGNLWKYGAALLMISGVIALGWQKFRVKT